MIQREELYIKGYQLLADFCQTNGIATPKIIRLIKQSREYHLQTCAFYRNNQIKIMVEKCALPGHGGRAWSWPGYAIDRTPYGVLQHELGHHVDQVKTGADLYRYRIHLEKLFSFQVWEASKEEPLTGYLGTPKDEQTFYMEWFAENFRLYVTNPDLCYILRPKFYMELFERNIFPVICKSWDLVLRENGAPDRIVNQAGKKITNTDK